MRSQAEKKAAGNAACRRYYHSHTEKINTGRAAYLKAHYVANRERILEQRRGYLEANREELKEKRRIYMAANKERLKAVRAARYAADPGRQARTSAAYRIRNAEKVRDSHLSRYGITQRDYERMLAEQDHACWICRAEAKAERHRVLHVDHDHTSGKVRALLCSKCNIALGNFKDNRQVLESAIAYLRAFEDA